MPLYGDWVQPDDYELSFQDDGIPSIDHRVDIDPAIIEPGHIEDDWEIAEADIATVVAATRAEDTTSNPFQFMISSDASGDHEFMSEDPYDWGHWAILRETGLFIAPPLYMTDPSNATVDPPDPPDGYYWSGWEWEEDASTVLSVDAELQLSMGVARGESAGMNVDLYAMPADEPTDFSATPGSIVTSFGFTGAGGEGESQTVTFTWDQFGDGFLWLNNGFTVYPRITSASANYYPPGPPGPVGSAKTTGAQFGGGLRTELVDPELYWPTWTYTMRPPRLRHIFYPLTAIPPRPWRLFPRDDRLSNNARLHPAPATRQQRARIFPADW